MWYDNNCTVQKMLQKAPDDILHQVAMPVDVFHFKAKHSEADEFCMQHCNPAGWPELMTGDKWTFNSSAAEQTNAWLAGYLAIVREMRQEIFGFFMDEMMRRRNDWIIGELDRKGHNPQNLRYDLLLPHLFR
jgi:hypothetical protein